MYIRIMYEYMHAKMFIDVCIYICICVYRNIDIYMYIYICICVCVCGYGCLQTSRVGFAAQGKYQSALASHKMVT